MRLILLLLVLSSSTFAIQPTLFPELFEEFAIYCSHDKGEFNKFAVVNDEGEVEALNEYWESCIVSEYWGNDDACFTGDAQLVAGFINYGDGNYAFGMGDEEWYERAYVTEDGDSVRAYFVDGPNDYEEEVFIMGRCNF